MPGVSPMTVMAHPCCGGEKVQVGDDVIDRPSPTIQVMVPVALKPDTVAMHVVVEPTARLIREQLTEVVLSATTWTVAAFDATMTGLEALSVTCSLKCHVPGADRMPVDTVGFVAHPDANEVPRLLYEVAPGASWSHWHV